jgi:dUTP pyrophosphatase
MNKIAKFEKVSFEQFKKDWVNAFSSRFNELDEDVINDIVHKIYDSIKLPKRATTGSAGYDFFLPTNEYLHLNSWSVIPTGIRCKIEPGWVLNLYPRSGHGFKYGIHLANTVGIIDSDYYYSDNEGHIMVKLVNDSAISSLVTLEAQTAFCQGVFTQFGVTVDDDTTGIRNGGFGSTSR